MTRRNKSSGTKGEYNVGYGKPPLATRFKKGVSGNPKGRKSGVPNAKTSLERGLMQTLIVTIDGKPQPMAAIEIMLRKQVEKALTGDTKATLAVLALMRELSPRLLEDPGSRPLSEVEERILDQFVQQVANKKFITTHSRAPTKETEDEV